MELKDILAVSAVLAPFLMLGLAALGWLYRQERERRKEIEKQLSDKKYGAYTGLVSIFFDEIKHIKAGAERDRQSLTERMIDLNKDVLIYGSDDVVKSFFSWQITCRNGGSPLAGMGDIIVAIRRDMGNAATSITSTDVLDVMVAERQKLKANSTAVGIRRPQG